MANSTAPSQQELYPMSVLRTGLHSVTALCFLERRAGEELLLAGTQDGCLVLWQLRTQSIVWSSSVTDTANAECRSCHILSLAPTTTGVLVHCRNASVSLWLWNTEGILVRSQDIPQGPLSHTFCPAGYASLNSVPYVAIPHEETITIYSIGLCRPISIIRSHGGMLMGLKLFAVGTSLLLITGDELGSLILYTIHHGGASEHHHEVIDNASCSQSHTDLGDIEHRNQANTVQRDITCQQEARTVQRDVEHQCSDQTLQVHDKNHSEIRDPHEGIKQPSGAIHDTAAVTHKKETFLDDADIIHRSEAIGGGHREAYRSYGENFAGSDKEFNDACCVNEELKAASCSTAAISQWKAHSDPVMALDYNSVHNLGVSASSGADLLVWKVVNNTFVARLTISAASKGFNCVRWRSDCKLFVACSWDGLVRLYSPKKGSLLARLDYHRGGVTCVAFNRNSEFVTAGKDKTLCVWDLYATKVETKKPVK